MSAEPPRFRESSFRRFETALSSILLNFPSPTLINPSPLSSETFCSRIRDAINAFLSPTCPWTSNLVDRDLLRRLRSEFVFVNRGAEVFVGPRSSGRAARANGDRISGGQGRPQFASHKVEPEGRNIEGNFTGTRTGFTSTTVEVSSEADLLSIVERVSSGSLQSPVRVTGKGLQTLLPFLDAVLLSGKHDVEYKQQPDGSIVLL